MKTMIIASDRVRVPEPREGIATTVHRYGKERAVVLSPRDFHRLSALEELASAASACAPMEVSDVALRAHREESTPGESITDPDLLAELLGE